MHRKLQPPHWRNWSGSVSCEPSHCSYPSTVEEVQSELLRCHEEGERLRIVGRGHAFTPLCYSDENQMSMAHFTGIDSVDPDSKRVWVRSGSRLSRLGQALSARGLSLKIHSDQVKQTIGGAVAAGSHGSGRTHAALADMVTGVRMVMADGSLRTFSADDGELFDAARVSLGALGVVTHLEVQCVDDHQVEIRRRRDTLPRVINGLDRLLSQHPHLTLYWFPFTDQVHIVSRTQTDAKASRLPVRRWVQDALTDNVFGWGLTHLTRLVPRAAEPVSRLAGRSLPEQVWVVPAHLAYGAPRWLRYLESEYAVPLEHLPEVLEQMNRLIRGLRFAVHLPITVRFAPPDRHWLSPAHQREMAYVAVHMPHGSPHEDYFAAMGEVFDRHRGRPSWGSLHDKTAHELRKLYPRFDEFLALRRQYDPRGVLLNPYLGQLLGVTDR